MATARPRRRLRTEPALTALQLLRKLHACGRDEQAWEALRPQALRSFAARMRPEEAQAVFEAYRRRPELLPGLPPAGAEAENAT